MCIRCTPILLRFVLPPGTARLLAELLVVELLVARLLSARPELDASQPSFVLWQRIQPALLQCRSRGQLQFGLVLRGEAVAREEQLVPEVVQRMGRSPSWWWCRLSSAQSLQLPSC